MFYYKLIFIFIYMLSITLCFGDTNQESDSSNPTYNVPGGPRPEDPNDPTYMKLAEESLQKFLQDSGNTEPYNVIKVEDVTTQIVAGTLTKINFIVSPADSNSGDVYTCQSTIWEQPWINFTNINVTCDMDDKTSDSKKQVAYSESETLIVENYPYHKGHAEQPLQKYLENNEDSRLETQQNGEGIKAISIARAKV